MSPRYELNYPADEVREFESLRKAKTYARQQAAEGVTLAPPEPEPTDWPVFPEAHRFGRVLAEDLNAPLPPGPWKRQSTPTVDGSDPNDKFLVRREETGLWTPHGKTAPLVASREHIAPPAPPQSKYDMKPGETYTENASQKEKEAASTRTQLQKWSESDAFWTGHEGDHVFILFGFRIMPSPPISKPVGGGSPGYSQIVQWKARDDDYSEVDSITCGADGIQFEFSSHPGNVEQRHPVRDVPHGLFHRVVLETVVSTRGKHVFWVQPNGKPWRKIGEWNVGTIPPGGYRSMGEGPYHRIVATTQNRLFWLRIAGTQIIEAV